MKHFLFILFAFLLFAFCIPQHNMQAIAQQHFKVLHFDKTDNTFRDSIKGILTDGLSWQDAEGEFRVLFTEYAPEMNKEGLQTAALYAYCFKKAASGWKKAWEVKDRIDACEADATCAYFPGSFTITDKDANNIGEVCFLYRLSCKGDVSPDEKKLIMYEAGKKYAIRGSTIMMIDGTKEGGEKKIDASFTKAAKPLLEFANRQWDKFGTVKY